MLGRNRGEQFEIFAIAAGGALLVAHRRHVVMYRHLGRQQQTTTSAGFGQLGRIGGEPVAEVHQCVDVRTGGQPLAFGETWLGAQMTTGCQTAAEWSGDDQQIAGPSARTAQQSPRAVRPGYRLAPHGDADDQLVAAGGVAAEQWALMTGELREQPRHHRETIPVRRAGEGDHGTHRLRAHRGEIAERSAGRLAADEFWRVRGQEVTAFDDGVDAQAGLSTWGPDAAIVTDAEHARRIAHPLTQGADEVVFAHAGADVRL